MSRSRRAPVWVEGYGSKTKKKTKRAAGKTVRRAKGVASGKAYKKQFNSWDIADYKFEDLENPKAYRK